MEKTHTRERLSNRCFKTSEIRMKYDTTYQEVLNQVRVYSINNGNNPSEQQWWLTCRKAKAIRYIVVGQESINVMKSFARELSESAAGLAGSPFYALGLA